MRFQRKLSLFATVPLLTVAFVSPLALNPSLAQSASELGQPLLVRWTQAGIAGESGTQWLIEPTGKWTAQRIEAGSSLTTYATGNLKPTELNSLLRTLNVSDVGTLPPTLGSLRANPQKLTIRWGEHATTLVKPGGPDISDPDGTANSSSGVAEDRMVSIAREVRKLTTN
jgi:hypothetical protein